MIKLNPSRKLQAVLAGAVATTQPVCVIGYTDKTGTAYDGDSQLTDLNGATAVDVCNAPGADTSRHLDYLTLRNSDSAEIVVTLRFREGATNTSVIEATLDAGEMLGFTHSSGWYVCLADGSRKSGAVQDLSGYQATSEKGASGGYVGLTGYAVNFKNLLGTIVSLFQNSNTAIRTYTFPNKSGTVAMLDDAVTDHTALTNIGTNTHAQIDTAIASIATGDASTLATAQAYADGLVVGLVDDRGNFDASGNAFPTTGGSGAAGAILKGDLWTISVAGTLGGHPVTAGDLLRALVNTPGSTDANWAITENNIGYVAENAANKNASGGYAGLTLFKLNLVNALGTVTSWFTTAATQARTWTMPDKDGTVAMTSDITGANSGTNTGDETGARIATLHHAASAKTTLVDADEVTGGDSAASFGLIRTVWSDVRTYLASKAWTWLAAHIFSDQIVSRAMLKDCGLTVGNVKGSAGGSQTFDYENGSVGSITPNATTTILLTNFPPTGNRGIMSIKMTNPGSQTINVPTTSWCNPDGSRTTSLSTYLTNAGITLQVSGTNEFIWWTDDAGANLSGVVK